MTYNIVRALNPSFGFRASYFLLFLLFSCNKVEQFEHDIPENEVLFDKAVELSSQENLDEALHAFLDIYKEAYSEKDYLMASRSAKEASFLYRTSGLYTSALKYGKNSLENAKLVGDTLLIAKQYSNLARTYFYCATSDEVKDDRTEMYLDSTQQNYNKVIELSSLLNKSDSIVRDLMIETYTNMSGIYFELGKLKESENGVRKALSFFAKEEVSEQKSYLYNTLGNINLERNEFHEAKVNYELALVNSKVSDNDNYLDEERRGNFYINLSWAKRKLEDITAYEDLDEGFTAYINANEKKQSANLAELTSEFNSSTEIEKAEQAKETLQKFLLLIGLLAVFIIGTLFTLYRATQLKQKNLELQIDKDQLLQQSELERLDKLSQTKVLNATIDGRESERKLIAEILHDSVSSLLSSANLHLQASRSVYDEIPMEIEKSQRIISEASDKIRNLSHELISSVLLKFGLSYSIFDLCEKYSNSQIELVSDINNIQRYDQAFEIKINNIIEELVNNILKHSNASEAIISIEQKDKDLHIEITDNGDGFKLDQAILKDGLGLNQIKARIAMMEGNINIDSVEGFGTTINIEVPIVERPIVKRETV